MCQTPATQDGSSRPFALRVLRLARGMYASVIPPSASTVLVATRVKNRVQQKSSRRPKTMRIARRSPYKSWVRCTNSTCEFFRVTPQHDVEIARLDPQFGAWLRLRRAFAGRRALRRAERANDRRLRRDRHTSGVSKCLSLLRKRERERENPPSIHCAA